MKTPALTTIAVLVLLCVTSIARAQSSYDLRSPNQKIAVRIQTGDRLTYDVLLYGKTLLEKSSLAIDIDHKKLGMTPKVRSEKPSTVDREIEPVVRQKFAKIREHYNELRLEMEGDYTIVFRAFD